MEQVEPHAGEVPCPVGLEGTQKPLGTVADCRSFFPRADGVSIELDEDAFPPNLCRGQPLLVAARQGEYGRLDLVTSKSNSP
jgi:hypothetical protein